MSVEIYAVANTTAIVYLPEDVANFINQYYHDLNSPDEEPVEIYRFPNGEAVHVLDLIAEILLSLDDKDLVAVALAPSTDEDYFEKLS